jgi:integrase
MVLDPRGHVGFPLELHNNAAKNGSGRVIPVHADLRRALIAWREISIKPGPIIRSERGGPMTALSIVVWFNRAFRTIGLILLCHKISVSVPSRAAWATR